MRERAGQSYRNLLRFYRYGFAYWRTIVLALCCMMVYSAAALCAVLLIHPLIDAFRSDGAPAQAVQADRIAEPVVPAEVAPMPEEDGHDGAQEPAFTGLREKTKEWFLGLPIVRRVSAWLLDDLSLTRIALVLLFAIGPPFLAAGFLQEYLSGRVVWNVLADMRVAVFDRLSDLSLSYFARHRTGDIVSRLTNDISRTETALGVIFSKIIMDPLMLVMFIGLALWYSPELALISSLTAPPFIFVISRFGSRIRRRAGKMLERLADVTDAVTQMLNGIRVVKAFHMETAEREEFRTRNHAQVQRALKLVRSEAWAGVLPHFLGGVLATTLVLMVADWLVANRGLQLKEALGCIIALGLIEGRVRRIVKAYNSLQRSTASVNRLFEIVDSEPDIRDAPDAVDLDSVGNGIEYRNVWFSYGDEPVLKDICLFVPAGKTYAIVGETGAGKSTLLDLIPRFYDVTDGAVLVGGIDVRHVGRHSLMDQIAIVGQHPFLFNRSIAENIRYGKPGADDEEVRQAAAAANIDAFIRGLPEGYETVAGEAGDRFSGGQRQCITIARALLKNAPILILDEATSSLDAESEMLVQKALGTLMEGRTTLVIAHRLSTVRHADRIVVLHRGRIVEQGTHEELLALQGEYFRLCRMQFASADGPGAPVQAPPARIPQEGETK